MPGLYAMKYVGSAGVGDGAVYIGHGIISGLDVGKGRYVGTYRSEGGRLKGEVKITFPEGGSLVTGQAMMPGQGFDASMDWPEHFADGSAQSIMIMGRPVQVAFEKISDLP